MLTVKVLHLFCNNFICDHGRNQVHSQKLLKLEREEGGFNIKRLSNVIILSIFIYFFKVFKIILYTDTMDPLRIRIWLVLILNFHVTQIVPTYNFDYVIGCKINFNREKFLISVLFHTK